MPTKVGIHCKPIGRSYLAFLDSRLHGNDRVRSFSENA